MSPQILALPGNEPFADRLADELGLPRLGAEFRQFPDGESYVRIDEGDDDHVFVVCTLDRPDDKFLRLAFVARLLKERGVRITLVAPYLGYMRQDRAFQDTEAVTAPMFAALVSSLVDGLITVDPHLHRIEHLEQVYTIECVNVHAAPAIAEWIAAHVDAPVLVGPDIESQQWVAAVAAQIDAPYVALQKIRRGDRDVEVSVPHLEAHADRTPVIIDDIISTARTMIETTRHLCALGTKPPVCVGVHAIFAGDAYDALLAAGAGQIVTTTTIHHPSNAIDIVPSVADACRGFLSPPNQPS